MCIKIISACIEVGASATETFVAALRQKMLSKLFQAFFGLLTAASYVSFLSPNNSVSGVVPETFTAKMTPNTFDQAI